MSWEKERIESSILIPLTQNSASLEPSSVNCYCFGREGGKRPSHHAPMLR